MRDAVECAACNKYRNPSRITIVVATSTCLRSTRRPTGACIIVDGVCSLIPIEIKVYDAELKEAARLAGMLGSE